MGCIVGVSQQSIISIKGVDGAVMDIPLSVHPNARVAALQTLAKLAERWLTSNLSRAPQELHGQIQVRAPLLPSA